MQRIVALARHGLAPLLLIGAMGVCAQQPAANRFPASAMEFLEQELPQMEVAVRERDRDYFEQALVRVLDFSDNWGFRTRANPALTRYAACTEAVSDFSIVGLCRIAPSLEGCDPGVSSRFDANVRECRSLAAGR